MANNASYLHILGVVEGPVGPRCQHSLYLTVLLLIIGDERIYQVLAYYSWKVGVELYNYYSSLMVFCVYAYNCGDIYHTLPPH